jgi:hypothetical protein
MENPLGKDWQIPPSHEIFPMWVKKPEGKHMSYAAFQDMHQGPDTRHYNTAGKPAHQQTKKAARQICSENMMRPTNKKELQKNLRKIEDEEEKEAYQHWYDNTENIVENEASLTYWKDDLHLKFKPSTEGERERPGELHGTFEACVLTEDGHKRVMEVADDWVKKNISEDARTLLI